MSESNHCWCNQHENMCFIQYILKYNIVVSNPRPGGGGGVVLCRAYFYVINACLCVKKNFYIYVINYEPTNRKSNVTCKRF